MKYRTFVFVLLTFALLISKNLFGQDSLSQKSIFPEGITFEYGMEVMQLPMNTFQRKNTPARFPTTALPGLINIQIMFIT